MKTDLLQSFGHCWVYQICWHIEYSFFTASSFRIRNSSTHLQEAVFAHAQEGRVSHSTFKVRRNSSEEIPLIQGKEQWLCFTQAAMKRYPTSKVRETQVRWYVLQEGIRGQTHWNHNHRKLVSLITRTTAFSNSMKLSHAMWGHPRRVGHGGKVWQSMVHWRREWQATSVFLP